MTEDPLELTAMKHVGIVMRQTTAFILMEHVYPDVWLDIQDGYAKKVDTFFFQTTIIVYIVILKTEISVFPLMSVFFEMAHR